MIKRKTRRQQDTGLVRRGKVNLLREYIRELLTERRGGTVHPKIYEMIASADEKGYKVAARNYEVVLYDKDPSVYQGAVKPIAIVQWTDDDMYGPCLGASMVSHSKAMGSYGPLLYDLAIEMTGGLVPDRTSVTDFARNVWDFYNTQRTDVDKEQLDDLRNTLTDTTKDNCEQLSAAKDSNTEDLDWERSSLSKKYSKQGRPVYKELEGRGMIV